MSNVKDCNFNSSWDGDSTLLTTTAKIDLDTGRVFDIEAVDPDEEVETLDSQYIDFDGIDGEFEVSQDQDNAFFVDDLDTLKETLAATTPKP